MIPDLTAEVVSPHDRQPEIDAKARMWLDAGVRLVLVAYPDTEKVYAHQDDGSVIPYGIEDTLVGDPVLISFAWPIADIFAFGPLRD